MDALTDATTLAAGLLLPEGPVAFADGSVVIVEVGCGRISRVAADGTLRVLATVAGGPNGAALGRTVRSTCATTAAVSIAHWSRDGCTSRPCRSAMSAARSSGSI